MNELKTYEVILNGPALGLPEGENVRMIQAERYESDHPASRASFFVVDEEIASFSNVLGVSEAQL